MQREKTISHRPAFCFFVTALPFRLKGIMYYYQFHIGDYRADTAHLSNDEDLAYRRLLDMYYDLENPIPIYTEWVYRRLRLDYEVVLRVLKDFFIFPLSFFFSVPPSSMSGVTSLSPQHRTH
jgi:hypothetical protein